MDKWTNGRTKGWLDDVCRYGQRDGSDGQTTVWCEADGCRRRPGLPADPALSGQSDVGTDVHVGVSVSQDQAETERDRWVKDPHYSPL